MKICVTPGLARSELLSEIVMYLVRVTCHQPIANPLQTFTYTSQFSVCNPENAMNMRYKCM